MIKQYIRRLLRSLIGLSDTDEHIALYKTFWLNYLAFGVKGVLKCPILVYSNVRISSVGKINLHCEIKRGILTIGHLSSKSQGITKFHNAGTIDLYGPVKIEGAAIIQNMGHIVFKGYNRVADGCSLIIREGLIMGEQSRFGFHCFVMDSDDHFTIDSETRTVHRFTKPITIGRYNWIANTTFIKKGVKTPDFLIVASANALLTKDYTDLPPYSVIGGCPAKLLKSGLRRIYNRKYEKELLEFFNTYSENTYTFDDTKISLDYICKQTDDRF